MNIQINAMRFEPDAKLQDFIETKLGKLSQFSDKIIGADVFLKLENTQNTENKVAEIRLQIPGNDLFAKKQCKTFEESTDTAVDALKKQLKRAKTKKR